MKQRAKAGVTPIPTIYDKELIKLRTPECNDDTRQIIEQLPTYYSCKTTLYHQRSINIPGLPKTTTDINLQYKWCLTTAGDQFLLPSVYPPMLIFSTINNLTHLAAANTIFCDGTFYACPSLFHQLYTVHAMVDGSMYPLVFDLLPGKDEVIYTRFFSQIRHIAQQHQLQLQPDTVFIDYETTTNKAARTVFPGVIVKGCFFHFTQCNWRQTQKCGLQTYYKENNDITRLVRRAAVLPLVPQHLTEDVWLNAFEEIGEADNVPDTTSFTDYVTEFWVEGHRFLWNHYHTEGPLYPLF